MGLWKHMSVVTLIYSIQSLSFLFCINSICISIGYTCNNLYKGPVTVLVSRLSGLSNLLRKFGRYSPKEIFQERCTKKMLYMTVFWIWFMLLLLSLTYFHTNLFTLCTQLSCRFDAYLQSYVCPLIIALQTLLSISIVIMSLSFFW